MRPSHPLALAFAAALPVLLACQGGTSTSPDVRTGASGRVLDVSAAEAGASQSPIDIHPDGAIRTALPALRIQYAAGVTLDVENTGSPDEEATIRANVPSGGGSVTVGGTTYRLLQFHFHAPAEHEVDGVRGPLEMHLVHRSESGALMVIGMVLRQGRENEALAPIFGSLPQAPGGHATVPAFRLDDLLPARLPSFRYMGSLTTAPYTEGVQWVVLARTATISAEQLSAFRELFHEGNSREVQPLNGRIVVTDVPR